MKLTDKELWIVEAIVANSYCSNNYKLPSYELSYEDSNAYEPVWTDCIDDNGACNGIPSKGKEISGVLSSLNKKGYVVSSSGRDGVARVTREGWKAYQETMEFVKSLKNRLIVLEESERVLNKWGLEGRPILHLDLELSLCVATNANINDIRFILN